nr:MAG TPA: Tape measure domain protein [Caudoviricetes sp.]
MAELEFNLRANFSQIKEAKEELERLRGELLKTSRATDKSVVQDLTDKYAEQKRKVTELSEAMGRYSLVMSSDYAKKMQSLTREVYAFELQADTTRRKIEKLSNEIAKMESKMRRGGLDVGTSAILSDNISSGYASLKDEKARLENLTGLSKQARQELQNMQTEYAKYSGSVSPAKDMTNQMTNAFAQMIAEMKQAPTVGEGISSLFGRLNGDARQLAMSLVGGLGFEQLAEHIFNVRSQFQQLEISFTTMLGSEQKAGALMDELIQTAARTPFNMTDVTEGAKQLLAYGIQANEVNDTLVHLGDIASGLNIPLSQLVYLYGTTVSQGRMFTMDLRQFMGRGIPLAEELGKILHQNTTEVQESVSKGKVTSDIFKEAIANMTQAGGRFGGLMEQQAETLQGRWSNIEDTIDQAINSIGQKTQGIFGTGLDLISSLIENWETLVKVIGSAAVMVGTYKAGLMAAASIQKVQNAMTMASITEELDSKLGEARDQENNFRSLNGKDTKQYRANRYKALGDAIADTSNIGDDKTEEIVSKQIEMARNEGLITEQMAQQLQTKRDLLVAQQKAADNERMEYENAKRTKEIEEEAARQKRADAEMAAEINAKAAKKAAIDEANNTPLGKAILNTNAIEEKKKQAEASIELAKEEAREQHGIVEEIGAQIKKQEELVAAKKEQVKSSYQNVTDLGGYDDSFGDDLKLRDQAVNQYVAEQQKLNDLKQKSYEASQKAYIADQKVLGMQEDLKGVTQELNQAIEEENRIYGETGASADEINKLVNEGVAAKEGDTAAVNANTAAKQGNTSTENANSTARNANTGATTRQSASNVANTTTENVNSVATGANTASQNVNTSAKQRNSFVTGMMSVGTKAATLAQSAFSWATNALTTSLRSLWAAMLANPLTTVITLVSTAISVFSMFGDETEDVATKATNLGNKASEASAKVRALFAILGDGKDAESHKDTIDALKNAYEEFGVKLDETIMKSENEASKVQELIKHKEDLIGVIEEQTVAMEHQNAIQQIYDTYKNDKDKAKTNFINDTDGVLTKEQAGMATMVVSQEDLDKMAKLQGEIDGLDKRTNKYKETVEKLRGVSGNVYKDIEAYYLNLKLTKEQIAEITAETYSYIAASTRANVNKQKSLDAEDKARAAVEKTRDAINKLSGSTMENAERNRLAKKSFKEMAVEMDEIRKICERTYHMKIKVDYDDKSLPAWIKNMSQSQRVESARARLSWLKTHKPGDTTKKFGGINKDYWTIYNENRGLQYKGEKVESTPTETEAQRKKRLAAEAKKKREAERAATKAEREANQKETMAGNKRKAEEDYSKTISSYSEKASDELSKRRTELIKNETEKEIAQINMSSDKEKKAIEDSIDKLVEAKKKKDQTVWVNSGKGRKANMWKQGKSDAEYRKEVLGTQMVDDKGNHLGKTIGQNSEDQIALIEKQRQLKLKEIQQAEIKDMLDFMKQYGSLEQQRYAILKEYTDKIDLAREKGDTFGAASAEMEMNDQLKKLNFTDFKDSINWDVVFQDMNRLSIPYLEDLRKKMKELLGSGTLEIDDMKTVSDQIYKIDDAISEQKDRWGLVNDAVREHRRLIDEAKDAQDRLAQARKGEFDAKADNMSQRRKIQGVFAESGVNIDTSNITSANKDKLMGSTKNLSVSQTEKLRKLFDDLAVSEVKVGKATKEVGKAQEEAKVKQDAAKKSLHDTIEEWAEGLRKIQEKLKDLPGLVDALGLGNTGFGKAVNNGMDALNSGTQAFSDFASGNYIGAAMNGIKTIGSLGKMFGIGGGNGAEVAKKTEELTESNDRLMYSIDKLKESIDKSSGYTAVSNYNAAYDAQKQLNTQTMDILKTQMGYHGAHHSNAYYWNLSAQDYAAINKTLAEQSKIRGGYTNSSINKVNSLEDIYKLTPEQMADIRTHNADVWKNMTDQGKYDKTEYWEQYTELAGKLEELTEQINENLTQTTFDSMKSDFINNLMDMSKSAKDFSNDFTTMLNQSMLNFALGDLMNKKLKPLYESWANKMKENGGRQLTPTELNNLKEEYDKIVQEGLAIRDNIADITGYKQSYEQSASSGSFESMSQDTGDELNGRFTAVQIATEGTYEETKLINTKLDAIVARNGGTEGSLLTASVNTIMGNVGNIWLAVDEGRTILAQSLMYLQSIDERQERWHKPMLQAFNDIHELKDKMSRL